MKIGIVSSGYDMLPLMQFLNKTEHEVHFFIDRSHWPWGEKSQELRLKRVQAGINHLEKLGVDVLLIPPFAERAISSKNTPILPLFETYLHSFVFKYSLVGKLGLLCEQADMSDLTQQILMDSANEYTLSDNQQKTKKFMQPFAVWKKNVRMRTYFLTSYGRREPMLRKTLKYDLRYFTDAGVDTLIPMSWGFLFYQKIIKTRVSRKKMRFHGLDAVEECFEECVQQTPTPKRTPSPGQGTASNSGSKYSITLHCTDTPTPLLEERKWMDVLSRGGEVEVKVESVM